MHELDPLDVDRDVPGAVAARLRSLLGPRREQAAAADPVFAADLADRVADFALGGGRLMRPQLLWWGFRGAGGGSAGAPAALGAAAALELIQTCALIHDDVMDGASLRRGRPALHAALDGQYGGHRRPACGSFGSAAAVLAGDLALVWADDAFAESVLGLPAAPRAAAEWRTMRTEMVAGQYLDLLGQVTGVRSPDRAQRTAVLKTALYSVGRPLALGATLADAPEALVRTLHEAGRSAGLAFQLHDDLQGAFGDPGALGKPVGGDLRDGKPTYLLAVARQRCERRGDRAGLRLLDEVAGSPDAAPQEVARLLDLLADCGARELVARRVGELCEQGVAALAQAGLPAQAEARIALLFRSACAPAPPPAPPPPGGAVRPGPVLTGEAR
ncbi:polyprenyl synthetase family protein [Streptomyces sp. C10-9-1]|uniref:polyprenyl synthetase family protein n=1 Tax=Streptomyces sp. C10-9-1 TaxID=1859285 RepID=UPI003D738CC7